MIYTVRWASNRRLNRSSNVRFPPIADIGLNVRLGPIAGRSSAAKLHDGAEGSRFACEQCGTTG